MTPTAEALLRSALRAAQGGGPEARVLGQIIADALVAEGLQVDAWGAPPSDRRQPLTGAERTARWREERRRAEEEARRLEAGEVGGDEAPSPSVTNVTPASHVEPPDRDESDECDVTNVTVTAPRRGGKGGQSVNGSTGEDSRSRSARPSGTILRERVTSDGGDVTSVTPPREDEVTLKMALPPELREAAAMVGVVDIDGAWLKFCGHLRGQRVDLAGRWQKWCVDERNQERRDRDRRGARGGSDVPQQSGEGASWRPAKGV
jgi:hypothetical protein